MLSKSKLAVYIVFVVALAIWMGSGVFDTISSHFAWHADPVSYIRGSSAPEGTVNPWPFTTAFLALAHLTALIVFARHRGPGRREVLFVLISVLGILIATGTYFVPTLGRLADHATLTDAQITAMSLKWIYLNVLRIVLLVTLFAYSLVGLVRLAQPDAAAQSTPQ